MHYEFFLQPVATHGHEPSGNNKSVLLKNNKLFFGFFFVFDRATRPALQMKILPSAMPASTTKAPAPDLLPSFAMVLAKRNEHSMLLQQEPQK